MLSQFDDRIVLTNYEGDISSTQRISLSEFNSLVRCTYQHDLLYRQGLSSIETPSYFSKGSYLHALMEKYHKAKGAGQRFMLGEASTEALQEIREEREAEVLPEDKAEIDRAFTSWLTSVDPLDYIVLSIEGMSVVEQEFYADIGLKSLQGEPVLFHGIIDLVIVESAGATPIIVEHKTASRAWSQVQFQQNYQGPLYAAAFEACTSIPIDQVRFNFFLPKSFNAQDQYLTREHKDALVRELQAGVWLRDSGSIVKSPLWGCGGCPVRSICLAESQGLDSSHIRETLFRVNEDRAARFVEVEG